MKYDLNNKEHLLQIERSLLPKHFVDHFPEQVIELLIQNSLKQIEPYFKDYEFAKKLVPFSKAEGAVPEDFFFRVLDLDDQRQVMTSYRAMGGDPNKVYIQIVYSNFEIKSAEQALSLAKEIKPHYAKFNPQRIRFFGPTELAFADGVNIWGDQHFLAAHHSQLKQLTAPQEVQIQLEKAKDTSWYELYRAAGQSALLAHPELEEVFHINSKQEMQDLVDKSPIFNIMINGHWGGVIAVARDSDRFFDGYCVQEIIIAEQHRGNGYAAYAQSELFKLLEWKEHDVIWGTIGTSNPWSFKTAQKCGRKQSGSYWFARMM